MLSISVSQFSPFTIPVLECVVGQWLILTALPATPPVFLHVGSDAGSSGSSGLLASDSLDWLDVDEESSLRSCV